MLSFPKERDFALSLFLYLCLILLVWLAFHSLSGCILLSHSLSSCLSLFVFLPLTILLSYTLLHSLTLSLALSCTLLLYLALSRSISLYFALSFSHIPSLFSAVSHSLSSYKFESFVSFPIACNSANSLRISYDAGTWNRSVVFDLVARCYFAICIMKPDVNFVTLDK